MKVNFLGPGVAMLLLVFKVNASSDWYVINNYEGTVGSHPIYLSVQLYDFGPGVNIEGSYFYNNNTPIPLYGRQDLSDLSLCEVLDSNNYDLHIIKGSEYSPEKCEFQLVYTGKNLSGIWKRDGRSYPVNLKFSGAMNKETLSGDTLLLPFWGHTVEHGFFGVYQKSHNEDGVVFNEIKVMNKKQGG